MNEEEELSKESFKVSHFINRQLKSNPGLSDVDKLHALKQRMQTINEDSSASIKKNVFHNYSQFIDTARDITFLEGQMTQLTFLLTDQRNLIQQMMDLSFSGATNNQLPKLNTGKSCSDFGDKVSMQTVVERVDGASHLCENPTRFVLLESDLCEVGEDSIVPIRTIRAFLLTDALMIATWIPHKMGSMRYKFEALYALDSVAVKDSKDTQNCKNLFRLSVFPEVKLYSCESARLKRKWLDSIELAKKKMLQEGSLLRQATIRIKNKKSLEANESSPVPTNPFDKLEKIENEEDLEWLKELPDELDVCIAQRDFDNALELLSEGREYAKECRNSSIVQEVQEKLAHRERNLVDTLCKELRVSGDRAMHRSPRATRKVISLLIKLGKSSLACDLYLKNRSAVIKQATKELKLAEEPLSYMKHLSKIVYDNLADVARDFTALFKQNSGCCAVLLLWASGELKMLVNLMLRHVIDSCPSLYVIGHSVRMVYSGCQELATLGLDLSFELDNLLTPAVEHVIEEYFNNAKAMLNLRMTEDKWKPNNLQKESSLNKFLQEMKENQLNMEKFICDDSHASSGSGNEKCRVWVSPWGCLVARSAPTFCRDLACLRLPLLADMCDQVLNEYWGIQLQHLKVGLSNRGAPYQQKIAAENTAKFIVSQVLPLCEKVYVKQARKCTENLKEWTPLQNLLARDFPVLAVYRKMEENYEQFADV